MPEISGQSPESGIETMPIDTFNDEIFGFLDDQAIEQEKAEAESEAREAEAAKLARHKRHGRLWGNPADAPGDLLDTIEPTGEYAVDMPQAGEYQSKLTQFLAEHGKAETYGPWKQLKTGDGDGTSYVFSFLPNGREWNTFTDHPVEITNSQVKEGVQRDTPSDEPNITLNIALRTIEESSGEPGIDLQESCTVDFPHANFLLEKTDPRHPENWDGERVKHHLDRVILPLLNIAEGDAQ